MIPDKHLVTVDIIIMRPTYDKKKRYNVHDVLLIKRGNDPFKNYYALPGGFVDTGEEVQKAARRELKEETGLDDVNPSFFDIYSKPGRDPRGYTISCVFFEFLNDYAFDKLKAGDDAKEVSLVSLVEVLKKETKVAFDHKQIIEDFWRSIIL